MLPLLHFLYIDGDLSGFKSIGGAHCGQGVGCRLLWFDSYTRPLARRRQPQAPNAGIDVCGVCLFDSITEISNARYSDRGRLGGELDLDGLSRHLDSRLAPLPLLLGAGGGQREGGRFTNLCLDTSFWRFNGADAVVYLKTVGIERLVTKSDAAFALERNRLGAEAHYPQRLPAHPNRCLLARGFTFGVDRRQRVNGCLYRRDANALPLCSRLRTGRA